MGKWVEKVLKKGKITKRLAEVAQPKKVNLVKQKKEVKVHAVSQNSNRARNIRNFNPNTPTSPLMCAGHYSPIPQPIPLQPYIANIAQMPPCPLYKSMPLPPYNPWPISSYNLALAPPYNPIPAPQPVPALTLLQSTTWPKNQNSQSSKNYRDVSSHHYLCSLLKSIGIYWMLIKLY